MTALKIGSAGLANFLTAKVSRHGCENRIKGISQMWHRWGVQEIDPQAFEKAALNAVTALSDEQCIELDNGRWLTAIGFSQTYQALKDKERQS